MEIYKNMCSIKKNFWVQMFPFILIRSVVSLGNSCVLGYKLDLWFHATRFVFFSLFYPSRSNVENRDMNYYLVHSIQEEAEMSCDERSHSWF